MAQWIELSPDGKFHTTVADALGNVFPVEITCGKSESKQEPIVLEVERIEIEAKARFTRKTEGR